MIYAGHTLCEFWLVYGELDEICIVNGPVGPLTPYIHRARNCQTKSICIPLDLALVWVF